MSLQSYFGNDIPATKNDFRNLKKVHRIAIIRHNSPNSDEKNTTKYIVPFLRAGLPIWIICIEISVHFVCIQRYLKITIFFVDHRTITDKLAIIHTEAESSVKHV